MLLVSWPLYYSFFHKYKAKKILEFKIYQLLLIFAFHIILLILIKSLFTHIIQPEEVFAVVTKLLFRITLIFLYIGIHTVAFYLFGRRVLHILLLRFTGLQLALISIGLGLVAFTSAQLILSLLGNLVAFTVTVTILVMILIGRPFLSDIAKASAYSVTLYDHSKHSLISLLLIFLTAFQSLISFILLMGPAPVAYDSLSYYFNLAKELGTTGRYVLGQYSMPIELLFGSGFALTRGAGLAELSEAITMHWAWWSGLLGWLAIYAIGVSLKKPSAGVLAATTYYTMPIIGLYMSSEPKSETFIVFSYALAILSIITWLSKHSIKLLFVACLLLWYTFAIKPTGAFGIAALLISLVLVIAYQKKPKAIIHLVLANTFACMLVVLPWFMLHIWEQNLSMHQLITRLRNGDYHGTLLVGRHPVLRQRQLDFAQLPNAAGSSSGYAEDYDRYKVKDSSLFGLEKVFPKVFGNTDLIQTLKIPWNVSTVQILKSLHFLISPIYLALFPALILFIFSYFKKQETQPKSAVGLVSLVAILYLLIWWKWGMSVVWYGIGLFVPLGIAVAIAWNRIANDSHHIVRIIGNICIVIPVLVGLYLQLSRFGNPSVLGYTVGKLTKAEAMQQLTGNYSDLANIINADPQIQSGERYVLLSGTFLHYFIDDYYSTALNDPWLDYMNAVMVSSGGDTDLALQTFQRLGVKYIVTSLGVPYEDRSEAQTLTKKFDTFMKFASQKLILVTFNENKGVILLQVP